MMGNMSLTNTKFLLQRQRGREILAKRINPLTSPPLRLCGFSIAQLLATTCLIGLIILGQGCLADSAGYEFQGVALEPPPALPDFELMAVDGQPFRLSDVEGDLALLYFGYTRCPDVCPLTMWEVKEALAALEVGKDRVHVIFITVDPERDPPEVLANYMAVFGPEFTGISDDLANVEPVMQPYGAVTSRESVANSQMGYLVSHTANLFLIGPQRQLLLQYPYGFASEDLSSDLTYLLQLETF